MNEITHKCKKCNAKLYIDQKGGNYKYIPSKKEEKGYYYLCKRCYDDK